MTRQPQKQPVLNDTFDTGGRVAAMFLMLNGILHIALIFNHASNPDTQLLAIVGVLFIITGWYAFRNARWAKFSGLALAAVAASLIASNIDAIAAPRGWTNIFLAIEMLVIVLMTLHLWRVLRAKDLHSRTGNNTD